tara:strand:- start:390 stop:716 length:327 start_codon:yes stop_codon:yes gene_type:complete
VLQTNDVGRLFATLQAAYGHSWAHKADAIPVWQEKLKGHSFDQIMRAANKAIDRHPNFPPSVGQLLEILKADKPRATTYLPPPPFDEANANKAWDNMEKLAGRKLRPD